MTEPKPDIQAKREIKRPQTIQILDDNVRFLNSVQRNLNQGGFENVLLSIDYGTAAHLLDTTKPDVALIDIDLGNPVRSGIDFVRYVVNNSPNTLPVVLSANTTQVCCFDAARAGAVDFFVKGTHIDISTEVVRLLDRKRGAANPDDMPLSVSDVGYLRSLGLTRKELEVVTAFSKDFPTIIELAGRIDQAPVQLRKVFSRIYEKLGTETLHQLARTLTICELFSTQQ